MSIEELNLNLISEIICTETGKSLTDVQIEVLKGAWQGLKYDEIAGICNKSDVYIKQDVGPKLWKILSQAWGEKISKTNFRATLQRQPQPKYFNPLQNRAESQIKIVNQYQDWGDAHKISVFFGRSTELEYLRESIVQSRCQLMAIFGIGGIGKTDLSVKLATTVQDKFDYIIWRSLLNSPPITDILADIIKFLSDQQEIKLEQVVDTQIERLLHYLSQHRCLLILDNMDTVLQGGKRAGQYKDGYSGYGKLLTQIGKRHHQSCLLLTSREKPKEFVRLEGKHKPIQVLELGGLGLYEGKKIVEESGSCFGSDNEWKKLIDFYFNGNPLALQLAAKHIESVFGGNIAEFLKQGKKIFNDLCQEILDSHFQRFTKEEKEVLYWLAINRESVSLSELKEDILSVKAKEEAADTVQSLKHKLPLEGNSQGFKLQPVLLEYFTKRLIEQFSEEIENCKIELLRSHALVKAVAKDYLRESQSRLILKPIRDRLIANLECQKNIETWSKNILSKLRDRFSQETGGYGAGNILNLLCDLKVDLKGYDFSYLSIWQAYLSQVNLNNINFAHANFNKCVFTQTFGSVLSAAFSPDATLFAVGDDKGDIYLWRVVDSLQILVFRGHTNWVWSIAFSPDGKILASGSIDKTIKLWDVSSGQCLKTLKAHDNSIGSVAFSPDGKILASGSVDKTIKLWKVRTGELFSILDEHDDAVWSVAFSPDGKFLASGSVDKTIKLWDSQTKQCLHTWQGHTDTVWSVAFSSNGEILASSSEDGTVKLWEVSTGECLKTLEGHEGGVWPITFSSDSETLASGSIDQTIKLWDVNTGRCLDTLVGHTSSVVSVAFSSVRDRYLKEMRQILLSGSFDQKIKLWDITTKNSKSIKTLQGNNNTVWSVDFSPDGQTLASGSANSMVSLWNIKTGKWVKNLHEHETLVSSVAFNPSGEILASGSDDQTIKLWDVATGQCLRTLREHSAWVWSITFSPDGKILASGSNDQTIKLWDVNTGQCLKTLHEDNDWVWSVDFSPDGKILASGCYNQIIILWDVVSGKCLQTLQGHHNTLTSIAFSPDGKILASSSYDKTIKLWNIATGECFKTLREHSDWVWSVTFSPNGEILISSGDDGTIKFWDISTYECISNLTQDTSRIRSITLSPDGSMLVSSAKEGSLKLWDTRKRMSLKTLKYPGLCEGANIVGVTGLNEAQKSTMRALGALEYGYNLAR